MRFRHCPHTPSRSQVQSGILSTNAICIDNNLLFQMPSTEGGASLQTKWYIYIYIILYEVMRRVIQVTQLFHLTIHDETSWCYSHPFVPSSYHLQAAAWRQSNSSSPVSSLATGTDGSAVTDDLRNFTQRPPAPPETFRVAHRNSFPDFPTLPAFCLIEQCLVAALTVRIKKNK